MKRLGIHFRLLLAVFSLISATTFTLGYMATRIANQFLQSRFEDRMAYLARYLALNVELGILINDRAMLERLAANLLSEEDVLAVTVLDRDGETLTLVARQGPGPQKEITAGVYLKTQEEIEAFESGGETEPSGEPLGSVRIAYSTQSIGALGKQMRWWFVWLSTGLALLAGGIFYFLSRSLVAPLTLLVQASRRVAEGDLALRARTGGVPETHELAEAFNAMLDSLALNRRALEEANEKITRQKTLAEVGKFSLMVAHEVKNPLSIIKTSLDVLKQEPGFACNDTLVYYMEDEIRRLNRLIEEFLAFARPAKPVFGVTDLNALLRELVSRFQLQEPQGRITLQEPFPEAPCMADADSDLLGRALGNILRNALDASGDAGEVTVETACDDRRWRAVIRDEGRGIPPEHLQKVFEPFFTTRAKGTGLGLAFADQVVRAHAGRIAACNRPEGGAEFLVEIGRTDERA